MKLKKYLVLQLCIVALVVTGCGASTGSTSYDSAIQMESASYNTNSAMGFDSTYMSDMTETPMFTEELKVETTVENDKSEIEEEADFSLTDEKLVYSCNLQIESKEYEKAKQAITDLIGTYNGVVQSEEEYDNAYRWYYDDYTKDSGTKELHIECRIPSKYYKQFLAGLETLGENSKVVNKSATVENITQQYYDNTIKIETLRVQEERLMNMLEQADNVQDMLSIESRLLDVQTELNILTNTVLKMDMDVAYSYVSIRLDEVLEYSLDVEKSTFFTRMSDAFEEVCDFTGELFEGIIVAIMYLIPVLILVGLPICLVVKMVMIRVRKYNEKHPRKPEVTIYRKYKAPNKEQLDSKENIVKEEKED